MQAFDENYSQLYSSIDIQYDIDMIAMWCVVVCSVVYWSMVVLGDGVQGQGQWS